jgi:hypothetical protein
LRILVLGTKTKIFEYIGMNSQEKKIWGLKPKNCEFTGTKMIFLSLF